MRANVYSRRRVRKDGTVRTAWYVLVDGPKHPDGRRNQRWRGPYPSRRDASRARAGILASGQVRMKPASVVTTLSEWILDEIDGRRQGTNNG